MKERRCKSQTLGPVFGRVSRRGADDSASSRQYFNLKKKKKSPPPRAVDGRLERPVPPRKASPRHLRRLKPPGTTRTNSRQTISSLRLHFKGEARTPSKNVPDCKTVTVVAPPSGSGWPSVPEGDASVVIIISPLRSCRSAHR